MAAARVSPGKEEDNLGPHTPFLLLSEPQGIGGTMARDLYRSRDGIYLSFLG